MRQHVTVLMILTLASSLACDGGTPSKQDDKQAEQAKAPTPQPPSPTSTTPQTPPPPPTTAPAPTPPAPPPQSQVDITGAFEFHGKLLVRCSDANPISNPTQQPPTGWQMRGDAPARTAPSEPALRFNFHNGNSKAPGEQAIDYPGGGKATSAIEHQPDEAGRWTSYFAVPGRGKLVLADDLQSLTVEATYADAINESVVIEVKAQIVCQ
jgi:hypothetical protein